MNTIRPITCSLPSVPYWRRWAGCERGSPVLFTKGISVLLMGGLLAGMGLTLMDTVQRFKGRHLRPNTPIRHIHEGWTGTALGMAPDEHKIVVRIPGHRGLFRYDPDVLTPE